MSDTEGRNKGQPHPQRPLRWVIWSAVSSLPQAKEISLSDQRAQARQHVARHGGIVVEELEVPGKSRSIVLFEDACERIPAYARLRDLLHTRAFDVLIFLDRSRLGRTAALVMTVTALCEAAGVTCYEMDAPPASLSARPTYADDLVGAIRAVGAQQEVRKLRDRHRMGMVGRVKKGLMPGRIPYGYRKTFDPGSGRPRVETDPERAEVVRRIIAMYLSGRGTEHIADMLNADGIPTANDRAWSWETVRNVITRAWVYAGYVDWRPRDGSPALREPGQHPAIISEDEAARVDDELEYRQVRRQITRASLLSGVCVCEVCGVRMHVRTARDPRLKSGRYLAVACRNRRPGTPEHKRRVTSIHYIMPALRSVLERVTATTPDELMAMLAENDAAVQGEGFTQAQAAVEQADADLAILEDMMFAADRAMLEGRMDAERHTAQTRVLAADIAAAKNRLAHVRQQLARMAHHHNRRRRLEEVRNDGLAILDNPDVTVANAWLRQHVRIYIREGKVTEITFI